MRAVAGRTRASAAHEREAMNEHLLFGIAGLLGLLWYAGRSPKLAPSTKVQAKAFCLHCNWEGRVANEDRRCGSCGSRQVSVLSV